MKQIILILSFFSLFISKTKSELPPNFALISAAFSSGNADALVKFFDNDIEISIFDKEENYQRDGALVVMKDFFSKNKPKSFSQVHQGASKGKDTQYSIGEISTSTGNYRVYLYMKVVNDNYVIQEIRIGRN